MSASLTIKSLGPTSLSLEKKGMNEEKLHQLIAHSSKYEQLWLLRQNYDDLDVIPIAQALRYNQSFRLITFSHNKIGDTGVIALAKALLFHPKINALYLERNLFYAPGINAMIELKSHVPRLTISLLSDDEVCATEPHRWLAKAHILRYAPEFCTKFVYPKVPKVQPKTQVKSLKTLCTQAVVTSFQEVRENPIKLSGVLTGIPEDQKENCLDLVADIMKYTGHLPTESIVLAAIREYPLEIFHNAMQSMAASSSGASSSKRRGMLKFVGFRN